MLRVALTLLALNIGLLALEIPRHAGMGPNWLAMEALALTGLFMLVPRRRWSGVLAALLGLAALLLTLMALLDALARLSLSRPLNVYLDYPLITSVYDLAVANLPIPVALAAVAGLTLILAGIALGVTRLLTGLRRDTAGAAWRWLGGALLTAGLAGVISVQTQPIVPRAISPAVTMVTDQAGWAVRTHRESAAFERQLAAGGGAREPLPLRQLEGVDVIVGFIESYGVSAVFDDRYGPVIRPRLIDMEQRLNAAGLHVVTGTLDAPTFGGQSWLAHATTLSGLWVDNQLRYELLLDTERHTLVDDFRATGHHTVVVMPAITQDWPEGRWYGFDAIFEADDMDYEGPPFNWVTMPDQYTWWFFEQSVRQAREDPVFGVLALISSHAPWVPVLPVIERWETIGDGAVFRQWEGIGESPESLWRDHDRVRDHFVLSVDYALNVATGYAERFVAEDTLLVVIGDHQPARLITGPEPSAGVPVHVISGDPALLEPLRARGFTPGVTPAHEQGQAGMDVLIDWFRADYGDVAPSP
ncbi:sulfatase-like hydrolase/transferase [Aquisalimonas sp.]|uniref:sulfatase-like hydrolase/transferase n=1 Tax=Aquisalimonas sp. TaxID=1872621 RepID=UPI0025C0D424|nr:sulfatase-like hydrolase/transferase [Aquisalimonas sp.]